MKDLQNDLKSLKLELNRAQSKFDLILPADVTEKDKWDLYFAERNLEELTTHINMLNCPELCNYKDDCEDAEAIYKLETRAENAWLVNAEYDAESQADLYDRIYY